MQILSLLPENQRKPLKEFSHRAAQQRIGKTMLQDCNKSLQETAIQVEIGELAGLIIDALEVSLSHFPKVNQRIQGAQIRNLTGALLYLKYGHRTKLIADFMDRDRTAINKAAISFLKDCNHSDYKQMVADLEAHLNMIDRGKGNLILSPITIQTIYDDYRIG